MPNTSSGRRHRHARRGNPRRPIARTIAAPAPPHLRVTDREIKVLERSRDRVTRLLEEAGLTSREIHSALQHNLDDIVDRRSAACPYEQEQARRLVEYLLKDQGEETYMVTAGNPRLRVPLDRLDEVDVQRTLRLFRTACKRLIDAGYPVQGLAVFELHTCCPISGEEFWEPHLHAILWGAPKAALIDAFRIRMPSTPSGRRRPVYIRQVYDLRNALRYCLKFRPTASVQYCKGDSLRWRDNRLSKYLEPHWHAFLARHRIAQLITARSLDLGVLRRSMQCELS